jgi:hypothetical protein
MTPAKAARTLIAAGTTNAALGTTRGTLDLRESWGGRLTFKITNGGTGPTVQCVANILMAHTDGATPAAGSAGATWKTLAGGFTPGTGIAASQEWHYPVDKDIAHLCIEFTGNTGQAVTVEAYLTEITDIS